LAFAAVETLSAEFVAEAPASISDTALRLALRGAFVESSLDMSLPSRARADEDIIFSISEQKRRSVT
jgi:hypothetical protein